jgi:hypothetical protein
MLVTCLFISDTMMRRLLPLIGLFKLIQVIQGPGITRGFYLRCVEREEKPSNTMKEPDNLVYVDRSHLDMRELRGQWGWHCSLAFSSFLSTNKGAEALKSPIVVPTSLPTGVYASLSSFAGLCSVIICLLTCSLTNVSLFLMNHET